MASTCKECKCKDCPIRSDHVYGCSGFESGELNKNMNKEMNHGNNNHIHSI